MSQKKRPGFGPPPKITDDEREAMDVCRQASVIPVGQRLGFMLAAVSDHLLTDLNSGECMTSLILLTATASGQDSFDDDSMTKDSNLLKALLLIEELRRRGLARLKQGYPENLEDELIVEVSLGEIPGDLSKGAARVMHMRRPN